jgi:hypothetical protein
MSRSPFAVAVLCTLAFSALAEDRATLDLYVSPSTGRDQWTGASAAPQGNDGPVATIERARDLARERRAKDPALKSVAIHLAPGMYSITRTLALGPQDANLALVAAPGEHPTLIGGSTIANFMPYKKGQILKADVNAQGFKGVTFHQLFFDGHRQHLARYPNFDPQNPYGGGWAYVDGKIVNIYQEVPGEDKHTLVYKPADERPCAHPEDLQVFVFARYNWWNNELPVKSIDRETRTITTAKDASYAMRPGDRYFVQNSLEELDAPGEWCLDKREGTLYFWPPRPITASTAVYAPRVATILDISKTSNITIRGLTFDGCDGAAIRVTDSTDCKIAASTIRNAAGDGVSVNGGHNVAVFGNDIYEIGSSCIALGGGDRKTLTPAGHRADDNYLHHFGCFYKQGCGVVLNGVGNAATHNLIHDGPRFGILLGGNNQLIEYNEIRHVSLETEDTGAIYSNGRDWLTPRGTAIRYNFIHDVYGFGRDSKGRWVSPYFAWGIYLDDDSAGVDVVGNVVARVTRALIHLHNARDNVMENNVLVDGGQQQVEYSGWTEKSHYWVDHSPNMIKSYESISGQPAWARMRGIDLHPTKAVLPSGTIMAGNVFRRNILSYRGEKTKLFRFGNFPYDHNASDQNLIDHPDGSLLVSVPKVSEAQQWEEWKKQGLDQHSVLADPQFVDRAHDNFRLKSDSPALKLGFEPIPFEKIGPYKDESRATWPIVQIEGAREHPTYAGS